MKCERCGKEKDDVNFVRDPYEWEIYQKEEMKWLCQECEDWLRLET